MLVTSAQATKILRQLNDELQTLQLREANTSSFVAAIQEDIESVRPEYNFKEMRDAQAEVEKKINEVIDRHLPVTIEFMPKEKAGGIVDLSKLPDDASDTLRIVRIGDYDACACIGSHVANTSEIGHFKLLNYDYADGRLRLRFKLV